MLAIIHPLAATDGSGMEIINWLDITPDTFSPPSPATDHGEDVITTLATANARGLPVDPLTDNAAIYTSRFTGGLNGFEYLLASLGIAKRTAPQPPANPSKIECFHQTRETLARRSTPRRHNGGAASPAELLPAHLQQPSTPPGIHRPTPAAAYAATPKAPPAITSEDPSHYRLRYDRTDTTAKSASDAPAGCTTSASAPATHTAASSPSPTRPASPSWT